MMNATSECPSATMASAMSAATSASVRPGTRNSGTRACTRSMAAPALRSASISAASLIIRSSRSTSVASTGSTPSTSASGSRCSAGIASVTAVAAGAPPNAATHQLVRVVAVDPVPHRQTQFRDGGLLERGQLQPRHHHRRLTGRRQHQRGEPLEGLRARTDQVAQVVARGDHQPGQSRLGGRGGARPPAGGRTLRRRSGRDSMAARLIVRTSRLAGLAGMPATDCRSCCSTAPACGFARTSACRRRSPRPTAGRSTRSADSSTPWRR